MSEYIKVEESFVEALIENAAWDTARFSIKEKHGDKKGDEGAGKDKGDKPDFTTDARKGDKGKGNDDEPDYETDDTEYGIRASKKSKKSKKEGKKVKEEDDDDDDPMTVDGKTEIPKPVRDRTAASIKAHPERSPDYKKPKSEQAESVETHTCPLCESTLDEELSDEKVLEHVAQIQAALATLEEGGDDDDDGPEPTDADLDAIEDEPDMDEKKKKKAKKESNEDEPDMDEKKKKAKKESKVMKKVKELKAAAQGK